MYKLSKPCAALVLALPILAGAATEVRPLHDSHRLARTQGPAAPGGDFTLDGADGPVPLARFRGQVVALYFGYTLCPDACPTALWALGTALKSLAPAELDGVQPIFVSVDPARDTPARLKEYTPFFHPKLVGVTGPPPAVARVARQYGVVYQAQKVASAAGYVIDHSSFIYVIDRGGRLAEALPHGVAPAEVAAALRRQLAAAR